jgi:hypothetical protein
LIYLPGCLFQKKEKPGVNRALKLFTFKVSSNSFALMFFLYCFFRPGYGDADCTHATTPTLPFPSQLYRCSKVYLHAKSRGGAGGVHLSLGKQLIASRALYNAFFFYLFAFSRFCVWDSA